MGARGDLTSVVSTGLVGLSRQGARVKMTSYQKKVNPFLASVFAHQPAVQADRRAVQTVNVSPAALEELVMSAGTAFAELEKPALTVLQTAVNAEPAAV